MKCASGKRRFHSEEEVKTSLKSIQNRSVREMVPTRVYHCQHCNGYHLTSTNYPLVDAKLKHRNDFKPFLGD